MDTAPSVPGPPALRILGARLQVKGARLSEGCLQGEQGPWLDRRCPAYNCGGEAGEELGVFLLHHDADDNGLFSLKSVLFLKKKKLHLFIFRQRGREEGKETSVCGCLSGTPYWGPDPQPSHEP